MKVKRTSMSTENKGEIVIFKTSDEKVFKEK